MGKSLNYHCSALALACLFLLHMVAPTTSATGGGCGCGGEVDLKERGGRGVAAVKLKMVALVSILLAGCLGVLIPVLGRWVEALRPESDAFLPVKALAAGVIFATALIHILPSAFLSLTSPCLPPESPLRVFPFAGFVSMLSALATMMVDTLATSYYTRSRLSKPRPADEEDDEMGPKQLLQAKDMAAGEDAHHRVVSQVLELGVVVHSVIIGISLGASESRRTITPLVGALSFHQFFEGVGLGGCIVQARFRAKSAVMMAMFFSLTTPMGILIGIGISSIYDQNSPRSLATEGILNAASAGILIYMALVDLLATDFRSAKMQGSCKLQLWSYSALFLGAGLMSLLAKWA